MVTLAELAGALPAALTPRVVGEGGTQLVDLTHDSRQIRRGWSFICVPGSTVDGHTFAADAVARGAAALVVEHHLDELAGTPQLIVDDTRRAHGHLAAAVHRRPAEDLLVVGITGTNGKTTTAHLIGAALTGAGRSTAVLGTLSGARTTPEASDLHRRLAGLRDDGTDAVVMEVSSHALALHRVDGLRVDAAVFTNLGRDHLDLHGSMEAYFRAKSRLFEPELAVCGVVNLDDTYGRLLADASSIPIHPYSSADAADVVVAADSHRFTWRGRIINVPIGGEVNVHNSLAALTCCAALGIDPAAAAEGLSITPPIPGRFELVARADDHGIDVFVDYAHTPDGLSTVLASARRLVTGGRVVVVFGCGGARDREKRPLMGASAVQGADLVIVTSDNPRDEDPQEIIDEVLVGVEPRYRDLVVVEPDRRTAIATALGRARPGDVVVIAGKGHETTQTIGATALPFDDRAVARELLEGGT